MSIIEDLYILGRRYEAIKAIKIVPRMNNIRVP